MQFDLQRARYETPGCKFVKHFNNAGSSLISQPVLEAIISHLQLEAQLGGYEATNQAEGAVEHVYDAAAALLNCSRDEIAFAENATRAWDMLFYSVPLRPGDRILTSISEYGSNYLAFLHLMKRMGITIAPIPNDEYGQTSVDALKNMLDERVKLIAITYVPTNGGLVNQVAAIGKVAREAGILYLVDACQAVGQMPVDVQAIGCDLLATTGRKYLRGPRGTGFLYVRRSVLEQLTPPFIELHTARWLAPDRYQLRQDARRFESWEINYAGKIGLGVAIDYAMQWSLEAIWQRVQLLAERLRSQLSEIAGVTVHDLGRVRCGIVTFTLAGMSPAEIKQHLAQHKMNVTVTRQEATLLDMTARGLDNMVRASVHYYNSEEEIDALCEVVARLKTKQL
ncbi:aminotransferase class V-fold PLP-dependent enzyme [Ktedonosporobacter rubrisoli]|uniref:Aminotransferase class V-fold PLP-dependent enzyme n=1 Tax=Ktedonosporobacter rubrisoli TaxID=2509675 RepID=A0A4P6JNY3_KTERU|nr:aminotransferase class V-fold PLP-dependent enzyme [Ktedonosporobacter rubrisoli]QBD77049.1 aminotransferase class V-fold PLP-dependent enzyme [Ktedonosporobacter rubrisoli]